jgi:phosphoribosyl 1,2-cyclic phosphate phosphodiesterase
MEGLSLTLLGTGTSQGVPLIGCKCKVCSSSNTKDKRLRTSALISYNGSNIVIDTGPDFRQQMLRLNVSSMDAVLFTHEHKDHIAGLDDIRAFNYLQQKDMPIYCNENVENAIRREFAYVFAEKRYPGIPQLDIISINENVKFSVGNLEILPLPVMHMYLPVLGFLFGDICYITDANFISEKVIERIKGIKYLVLNALRKEKHPSHFTLDEAIVMVEKINPQIAVFTHISHQLGLHNEIQNNLPDNILLGYDGMVLK